MTEIPIDDIGCLSCFFWLNDLERGREIGKAVVEGKNFIETECPYCGCVYKMSVVSVLPVNDKHFQIEIKVHRIRANVLPPSEWL